MSETERTPAPGSTAEWYCPTCDTSYPDGDGPCPRDGTRLIQLQDADPLIGREIDGRFMIRERLGQGGMGVVYRAWQASVGREVAIKVIRPRPGQDAAAAKRFLREAKLSSQLSQPSTVAVIDFGQSEDGTLYLVMELLRGRTLGQELRAHGRMRPERAIRIGAQICDALEAAHKLGIIHRDLKPANVMILDDPPGRDLVKVLDFGLAKAVDSDESTVTQSGRLVGTPSHLAPEVALGGVATPSSDLYSVGVMLFEMLDGRSPFLGPSVNVMIAMHAYQPAPDLGPHVPPALAALVARTLAKKPEARPASAADLRDALEQSPSADAAPGAPESLDTTADGIGAAPLVRGDGASPAPGSTPFGPGAAARSPGSASASSATRRRRWPWAVAAAAIVGGAAAVLLAVASGGGQRDAGAGGEAAGATPGASFDAGASAGGAPAVGAAGPAPTGAPDASAAAAAAAPDAGAATGDDRAASGDAPDAGATAGATTGRDHARGGRRGSGRRTGRGSSGRDPRTVIDAAPPRPSRDAGVPLIR